MGQLVAQKDHQLLRKIIKLHTLFSQHEDNDAVEKLQELGRKTLEKEFAIAFCGHFSAGKSSMINRLVGADILPSSPIPTSANLVKIKSGEEYARVFFREGTPKLYPAPYDFDTVKNYCKDGDQIESLEISYKGSGILRDVIIMDTPGIDSADDAHRISTESALHMADIVFYVMDYNHVQSELNFLFTKELTEAGKELYLVINMIDKHREEELRFEDFQKSVSDSFATWGVQPQGIFYTSLKKDDFSYNQFAKLQKFLHDRIDRRDQLLPESIFKSLIKVSEDHVKDLTEEIEAQIVKLKNELQDVPEAEWALLHEKSLSMKKKKTELKGQEGKAATYFSNEIDSILKNAYLMPFKTRELAESYLKSIQPDFKIGLFFSKQKTQAERESRLEAFYQDLSVKVQEQIDWHIREFLLNLLKEDGIQNESLRIKAQEFHLEFSKDLLAQVIKTGAVVSGDYVLTYTNDVVEALKRKAREQLHLFKDSYLTEIQYASSAELTKIIEEQKQLQSFVDTYETIVTVQQQLHSKKEAVFDCLYNEIKDEVNLKEAESLFIHDITEEVVYDVQNIRSVEGQTDALKKSRSERNVKITEKNDFDKSHNELNKLVEKLNVTADDVVNLPGLKKISKELMEKAGRLGNQQFTVALFGAFSAGKSSFANALIGDNLLPVSPNPTTAAINKIKPIDSNHPHGTVVVKVKAADQLLEEVNRSLKFFNLESLHFQQALDQIRTIHEQEANIGSHEKLHYTFLQAFSSGFTLFENRLGEAFSTNLESFRGYVADEGKSCFVEWIEVYYDCDLTREGISLVDTPGADSINARHTGVAFDYIKNSDAILFVTYYNHAFSRADREFLIQLGRVKDSFELDKMFFIVNAIDLANSEEELEAVLEYVEGQLVQYGIRNPHLFPVSSLAALKEKKQEILGHSSRFIEFEQSFYSFIANDLMKMAMDSAEAKWKQALHVLERLIHSAQEGQEEKTKKIAALTEEKGNVLQIIQRKDPDFLRNQLLQEADELVYYIKQRVFLRFGVFFKESFNPALLKEDGRDLKKALQSALDDLISSIGYDFLQEMRATTLRVETYIHKLLNEFQVQLMDELKKENIDIELSKWELSEFNELDFEEAFKDIDKGQFRKTLGLFKNPKAFFEKNEKKIMSEEFECLLQKPADDYLQTQNQLLKDHYSADLDLFFTRVVEDFIEQIEEYYTGLISAMTIDFPIGDLEETYNKIKKLA